MQRLLHGLGTLVLGPTQGGITSKLPNIRSPHPQISSKYNSTLVFYNPFPVNVEGLQRDFPKSTEGIPPTYPIPQLLWSLKLMNSSTQDFDFFKKINKMQMGK